MNRRRFTDEQLVMVRNDIPIEDVIKSLLKMPSKVTQGIFRFRCPVCGQFDTAINLPVNLARCFDCRKNFNPIDMVMAVRNADFVSTVKWLIKFKAISSPGQRRSAFNYDRLFDTNTPLPRTKPNKGPVAIKDIISRFLEKNDDHQRLEKMPSRADIAGLEQIVTDLSRLIVELRKHHHKPI
jgi:hypothetical protein